MSFSSSPKFVPRSKQHSGPGKNTCRFLFSRACYFYTGTERMNKRPLGELFIYLFIFNGRPPLSQTIAPYLPLCQSCLPSFHVQTSWRQRNPLGALLPGGTCAFALAGVQQKSRPDPGSARPGPGEQALPRPRSEGPRPGRRGAPGEASLGRGWSLRPGRAPARFLPE